MTFNLVEMAAGDDECYPAPACRFGNIVRGHACYCHHEDGPRKCHVWRYFGDGPEGWHKKECELMEPHKEK